MCIVFFKLIETVYILSGHPIPFTVMRDNSTVRIGVIY